MLQTSPENHDTKNSETILPINSSPTSNRLQDLSPSTPNKLSPLPPLNSEAKSSNSFGNFGTTISNVPFESPKSEKSSKIIKDLSGNPFTIEKIANKTDNEENQDEKLSSRNLKQKLVKDLIKR